MHACPRDSAPGFPHNTRDTEASLGAVCSGPQPQGALSTGKGHIQGRPKGGQQGHVGQWTGARGWIGVGGLDRG